MIVILQVIAAMFIGICYYMLAVAMTVYDGIISMIFQPIMGGIFSGMAILLLLLVGLPIRLSKRVNRRITLPKESRRSVMVDGS